MAIWCFSGFAGMFPIVIAAIYWKRLSAAGVIAGLLTNIGSWLYFFRAADWGSNPKFEIEIGGIPFMPVVAIFLCSTVAMTVTTLVTCPPSKRTLDKFFD